MLKRGHQGAAMLVMAPVTAQFGVIGLGMSIIAFLTCRTPDLDLPEYSLGMLEHRGWTHTIWFAFAVTAVSIAVGSLLTYPVFGLESWIVGAAVGLSGYMGVLSHLFADGLTKGRGTHAIRPFYPLSTKPIRIGLLSSSSRGWNTAFFAVGFLVQIFGVSYWFAPVLV